MVLSNARILNICASGLPVDIYIKPRQVMKMGPFNIPWSTFTAFIVIGGSFIIALAWAIIDTRRDSNNS
jgi:hypothetical protein